VTLVPRHHPGPRPQPSEDALGERRGLQSNVRNRNDLPERGLTHRADREKSPRRPPISIENRTAGVDLDADPQFVGAGESPLEQRLDERIRTSLRIAPHALAGDDAEDLQALDAPRTAPTQSNAGAIVFGANLEDFAGDNL
jgi:hypothetical protein